MDEDTLRGLYYVDGVAHLANNIHEIDIGGGFDELIIIDKVYGPYAFEEIEIVLDKDNSEWIIMVPGRGETYRIDANLKERR